MSWFDQTYTRWAVPELLGFLGERQPGVYIAADGTRTQCAGIRTNTERVPDETELGERLRVACEWIISSDPESPYGGVADVETDAVVEFPDIDGAMAVDSVQARSGSLVMMSLVQLPATRRSRPAYRRA